MGSFKNNSLIQGWLIILLSVLFSVSLAAVNIKLSPVIEENKTKETMEKIPGLITGGTDTGSAPDNAPFIIRQRSIKTKKAGVIKTYITYDVFGHNNEVAGHVIKASGQGYADKIELLLGLDPAGEKITGLFILDQKETPGLGNKIIDDDWRGQFTGKSSDTPLVVIKGNPVNKNEIDAISGATISSRSVTDIINSAIGDVKKEIAVVPESYNEENI
ncbi:MAG: FMN-binding protein [Deltaproteobacteria bacterium]|jgi:electron transport complex protein RnfG|nr:FMN-binding protein [Deltaproteobacteria bacterium]